MERRGSSGLQGTGTRTRSLLLVRRKCEKSWLLETFSERSHDSGRKKPIDFVIKSITITLV